MGRYVQNLIVRVIDASEADTWENAVQEWEIVDCEEDEDLTESCVCGKEELRYLFTIRNVYNGNLLFPIGSSCIKKFGRIEYSAPPEPGVRRVRATLPVVQSQCSGQ